MKNQIKNQSKKFNLFLSIGGAFAIIGLATTTPELATNKTAQEVAFYSGILSFAFILSAVWDWAKKEDKKNGVTLSSELGLLSKDIKGLIRKLKNEVRDEFALDEKVESIKEPKRQINK